MHYQLREVKKATVFRLLKQKPALLLLGILLTILPAFMLAVFALVISIINTDFKEVDHEKINKQGKIASAKITGIEEQTNITINNEHPIIIYYNYTTEDSSVNATFRTLELDKVSDFTIGDQVNIKYIQDESIITDLKPFRFPLEIVYLITIPFFFAGITAWILLFYHLQKALNLYKYGTVKEAELIAISPKSFSIFSSLASSMIIYYKYETTSGQKVFGKSTTNDYAIINTVKPGELIKIFVSSKNEQESCFIPRLESEYNNWKIH
jgi:hypothetical protein